MRLVWLIGRLLRVPRREPLFPLFDEWRHEQARDLDLEDAA